MTKDEKDVVAQAGWHEPIPIGKDGLGRIVYYDSALAESSLSPVVQATSPSLANHEQVGGDHYRKMPVQLWDYVASNRMGYLEGNIIKYVTRWSRKGGVEDLEKARHYLEKLIELQGPSGATEAKR